MSRAKSSIRFVGLHAHSTAGSPFDAIGYPQQHMDFAYENGCDALALTDHGNCNGLAYQVLHAKNMEKEGKDFKPIYGCEAYYIPSIESWTEAHELSKQNKKKKSSKAEDSGFSIEDETSSKSTKTELNRRSHLILLAQNQVGLNNIFQLVSDSYKPGNFYRYPRIDLKMLREHSEGIIASSACLGGIYASDYWRYREEGEEAVLEAMRRTSENMLGVFGDRWHGELQWWNSRDQHNLNKLVIQVAKEYSIPLITTCDSHFYNPEVWKDRELYKRLHPGMAAFHGEMPESIDQVPHELYPKNGDQVWESYKKYSKEVGEVYDDELILESIERTHKIAHERIEKFYPDNTIRLPSFVVPEGMDEDEALHKAAFEGLKNIRGNNVTPVYLNRLEEELLVIKKQKFSRYFLTMKSIVDKSTEIQLAGPSRGSAGGSLVAYALGIVQIDPVRHNLLFSRFLRADAKDYPDIDFDVSNPMEIKEMLVEEWGDNNVVPISNWNTLQLKSLIKDISKLYEIPFAEVNQVTGRMIIEATAPAKQDHGITTGVYTPTFEELMKYSPSLQDFLRKYPGVRTHINTLRGQIRSCSRHAGGLVVGEELNKHMPLIYSKGVRQTPWTEGQNVRHLEPMGFIKFDILGLKTLRVMEDAISKILTKQGVENPTFKDIRGFYNKHLHPDKINFNNESVYENIFHSGKWAGIFQFTEAGAQSFCERARPSSLVDIAAITSIFRPGPLGAKVDRDYIVAKESPDQVKYIHPLVKEVTEETYGFLIFQEQIAILAHKLGDDISLEDGNLLRKLLTKKGSGDGAKKKQRIYDKFSKGCRNKGLSTTEAEKLWKTFEYFSGYGFNKSHAIGYSVLSFQCAWLLNYHPSEWLAAFLDKEPDNKKEKAINIVKNMGFDVETVDINRSGVSWAVSSNGKLLQPLTCIKGLGEKAIEQIMANRPFKTLEEFIFNENISYSKMNKKSLDVLIRSGACKDIIEGDNRFKHPRHFWCAVANDRPKNFKKLNENIAKYSSEPNFTEQEYIENSVSLTGIFPFELVLDRKVLDRIHVNCVPPVAEFDEELGICWFIPRNVVERKTKKGKTFFIVDVIDDTCQTTTVKCWGIMPSDKIHINRPYVARLDYDPQWGLSTRSISKNFKLIG